MTKMCVVRASRLVALLLILERRGRTTAARLAEELEVSERTIHRDVDGLLEAGVPIVAIRGREGGFELIEGYRSGLSERIDPALRQSHTNRAEVRISSDGRRMATLLGRPGKLRVVRRDRPEADGWIRARFGFASVEGATLDLLALGPEVEVLRPAELRSQVAATATAIAALYRP